MTYNWYKIDDEVYGTTDNMVWMSNQFGNKALFKPDLSGNDYIIENNVYRIASFFEVPCSRVEKFRFGNIEGFLSILEDTKRYHRINGADLYQNGEKYNSHPISAGLTEYNDDIEYSLQGLKKIVTEGCFVDICKVAFVDALCRNQDRHIGNIDFLINLNGILVTVAPMYDNVLSLSNSFSEMTMLPVRHDFVQTHKDVIKYLQTLEFMDITFKKIRTNQFKYLCDDLEYGDFIYERALSFSKRQDSNTLNRMDLK